MNLPAPARRARSRGRPNPLYFLLRQLGGQGGDWTLLWVGFLFGLIMFLLAGYLGNPHNPNPVLRHPWPLFTLFCVVMIALEASILLDPTLPPKWRPSRARVITSLAVTGGWIVLTSALYLVGGWDRIAAWLQANIPAIGAWVGAHHQIFFLVLNLLLLAVLGLGARFATYSADPPPEPGAERPDIPGERLIGDLIFDVIFCLILALLFNAGLWQSNIALAARHPFTAARGGLTPCDLSWDWTLDPAHCAVGLFGRQTISVLDLGLATLCFIAAVVALAVAGWHEALARGRPEAFPVVVAWALRDIFRRRVTFINFLLALRFVWPVLLLAATVLLGLAARMVEVYLYDVATASGGWLLWPDTDPTNLELQFGALALVALAILATICATTVQIIPRTPGEASLRPELAFVLRHALFWTQMFVMSYWALSLIVSVCNAAVVLFGYIFGIAAASWTPFVQPDPLLIMSAIVAFIAYRLLPRRARGSTGEARPLADVPADEVVPQ